MKLSAQSHASIASSLREAVDKYIVDGERTVVTDIHLQPKQDSAMLMNISDQQIDDALNDESEERVGKLNKAIKKLDAEERALISLFYNEEKTIGEIALILGLTESNAKVKLHRIRKKLYILITEAE